MKLGISTYSLYQALGSGAMSVTDVIDYVADLGAEHVEIVPLGFDLTNNPELVDTIRNHAESRGIELSNYAIGANFADLDDEAFAAEVERVKREVDIAAALGVKRMRHDVASSPDISIGHFLQQLPRLTEACRQVADSITVPRLTRRETAGSARPAAIGCAALSPVTAILIFRGRYAK
ncbi:sugar phosphate isomerase/epimerase family protein [Paenibacillus sp. MCAF20]